MSKPTVGIFGLTGCAGDQLVILNCEDELLTIVDLLDIRSFVMASSAIDEHAQLDVALVEGAVVTDRDEAMIRRIRERSKLLVAIGACAVSGGIPGMAPQLERTQLYQDVYGADAPEFNLTAQRGKPLSEVVQVDGVIPGCPIEKHEIVAAIANLLQGNLPTLKAHPVCVECRMNENRCLLIRDGQACLGAVTRAGCFARCPTLGVACIGCRGLAPDANLPSFEKALLDRGYTQTDIRNKLDVFGRIPENAFESAVEAACAD